MTENTTVIVIGGGYAGTLAANQLLANKNLTVTLVNPRPHFVERIRLHQLVAGNATATADYDKLLNPAVSLVVDKVTYIDAGAQKLELASGAVLPYDYLVYAVGSTTSTPDVPGVAEYALSINEFEHAQQVRTRYERLAPDAPIVVVGAGLTGVELAGELAEAGRRVTLICGTQLLPSVGEPARRAAAKRLRKLGVDVQAPATAIRVDEDSRITSYNVCYTKLLRRPNHLAANRMMAPATVMSTTICTRLVPPSLRTSPSTNRAPSATIPIFSQNS